MISKAQMTLIQLLVDWGPLSVEAAAELLDKPVKAISIVRTMLLRYGWIHAYELWASPMVLTDKGRAALRDAADDIQKGSK
jgi:predicted transcriptional regulator